MSLLDRASYFDSNGVKIRYLIQGEGEPVILMHGFIVSMGPTWIDGGMFDALSQDHRVVAFDLRGHGGSGKPHDAKSYGLEMAWDVPRLMDHLKIERAQVVGYSLGGVLALKLLDVAPERLRSIALGGAGWEREKDPKWQGLAGLLERIKPGELISSYFWPNATERPPREVLKIVDGNDPAALAALSLGMFGIGLAEETLRTNRIPILCVFGEHDPLKETGARMVGVASRFEMRVVPGLDHHTLAGSDEFSTAVRSFISEHTERFRS
jgi:pimeloyl-ACP methyl ester carboxylesterase